MKMGIRMKSILLLGFLLTLPTIDSFTSCREDQDCPKPNMICNMKTNITGDSIVNVKSDKVNPQAMGSNKTNKKTESDAVTNEKTGRCTCLPGWVAWKWECQPSVPLGGDCVSSVQCQAQEGKHVVCHPLTHRCSCGPGSGLVCGQGVEAKSSFEAKGTVKAIFVPLKRFARPKKIPAEEGHGQLAVNHEESQDGQHYPGFYKEEEDQLTHQGDERKNQKYQISAARLTANVTVIRNAVSQALNGSNENREEPLIRSQRDGVMLVMMLMVALGTAAAITLLYLRALQERRMSQVALKSLIQFLSERDVKDSSVKTSEDLERENQCSDPPANMEGEGISPVFDFPAPGSMMSLPSKITLAPLEGENLIRFPSPHVSHAKLPAIRGSRTIPRKREKKKYEEEEEKKYEEGGKKVEEVHKYEAKKIYEELNVAKLESRVSSGDTASMTTLDSSTMEDQPPSYEELLKYN